MPHMRNKPAHWRSIDTQVPEAPVAATTTTTEHKNKYAKDHLILII
jgi:hypothetical protein